MAAPATAPLPRVVARRVHRTLPMTAALLATDICASSVAVIAGFLLWSRINPGIPPLQPVMALAPACCVAILAFEGLYPGIGMTAVEHIRRSWRGISLVYLIVTASMFIAKTAWFNSRGGFLLSWLFSLILLPAARWTCSRVFGRRDWWGVPVMILGAGETGRRLIRTLNDNRTLGYRAVVCLDDDPARQGDCLEVPVPGPLAEAPLYAAEYGLQYALVAMPGMPRQRLTAYLRTWSSIFPHILIVPDLFGMASLWITPRDMGGILGLEITHNLLNPTNRLIKRAMDVVGSSLGLVVSGPLMLLAALWIKIVSPGTAFFIQQREGINGKPLRVLKLRTMHRNAEEMLDSHLAADPEARAEWDRFCKLKHDPRIIPGIGQLLRKTSLDEIPQLWNILKGEMSLVGPRPFPAYHNLKFDREFRSLRTQVRPGLTGLWQVSARSDGDLDVQLSLDSYYIRNWSLWLDLYLVIRTIRVVLSGDGAY